MPNGIIGKKLGITQRFGEDGSVIPLTVVRAGPCVVVQRKTKERDGYDAIQVGLVEPGRKVRANKPRQGHFQKASVAPVRVLREFRLEPDEDLKVGESVKVSMFAPAERVNDDAEHEQRHADQRSLDDQRQRGAPGGVTRPDDGFTGEQLHAGRTYQTGPRGDAT